MCNDRFLVQRLSVLHDHNGMNGIAPLFIGYANNDDLDETRKGGDCIFDFGRKDLLTDGDNNISDTVDNMARVVTL